jgi:hypothetical protein
MELFTVHYQLKFSVINHGEFSKEYLTRNDTMINSSNFLPEIFTDIFEKHRHEWVVGVEINEVIPFNSIGVEWNNLAVV